MQNQTFVDEAILHELATDLGGNVGRVQNLIGIYLDEAPRLIGRLTGALEAARAEDVRAAAHSLKSASAAFGAMRVSELAAQMEKAGAVSALDEASELFQELTAIFPKVEQGLRSWPQARA